MVWGGDVTSAAHSSSRSNVDLEIGCLIDLATGLLTFTVNGKELSTSYQVLYISLQVVSPLYSSTCCLVICTNSAVMHCLCRIFSPHSAVCSAHAWRCNVLPFLCIFPTEL